MVLDTLKDIEYSPEKFQKIKKSHVLNYLLIYKKVIDKKFIYKK